MKKRLKYLHRAMKAKEQVEKEDEYKDGDGGEEESLKLLTLKM